MQYLRETKALKIYMYFILAMIVLTSTIPLVDYLQGRMGFPTTILLGYGSDSMYQFSIMTAVVNVFLVVPSLSTAVTRVEDYRLLRQYGDVLSNGLPASEIDDGVARCYLLGLVALIVCGLPYQLMLMGLN